MADEQRPIQVPAGIGEQRVVGGGWSASKETREDGKWYARVPNPRTMGGYFRGGPFDSEEACDKWMESKGYKRNGGDDEELREETSSP